MKRRFGKFWSSCAVVIGLFLLLAPVMPVMAQTDGTAQVFEARVTAVLDERELTREDGSTQQQQDLRLEGLTGEWRYRTFEYRGISDLEMFGAATYELGDRVVVQLTQGPDGEPTLMVIDYVRRGSLLWLFLLFVAVVAVVGRGKGLRALVGLAASFAIIVKLLLPAIVAGWNPLLVGLVGSAAALALIIYVTDGWRRQSHLSVLAVLLTLGLTLALSALFTALTRLSGMAQEEASFLIGQTTAPLDFHGLLLAGILIGTIGVLDDVIVGQVEAVRQIKEVNPRIGRYQAFVAAYRVGNAHLGAIINTLFLTYAGASLPLLLLFALGQEPFVGFGDIVNHEVIATEIVRTLVGAIGVAAAMPIATGLAAAWLKSPTPDARS